MKKHKYNIIISLGGNCAAAMQADFRGLRYCSLPFDYLFMVDTQTIQYLKEGFSTRFARFFERENMVELVGAERGDDRQNNMQYKDMYTGWRAIHHFPLDVMTHPESYAQTMQTFRRRIDRLFERIENSKRICFVLGSPFAFDINLLSDVQSYLSEKYPTKRIDWRIVQFSASSERHRTMRMGRGRMWVDEYTRPCQFNDFATKELPEWKFLDKCVITPCGVDYHGMYKLPFYLLIAFFIQLAPIRMFISKKYSNKLLKKINKWWR